MHKFIIYQRNVRKAERWQSRSKVRQAASFLCHGMEAVKEMHYGHTAPRKGLGCSLSVGVLPSVLPKGSEDRAEGRDVGTSNSPEDQEDPPHGEHLRSQSVRLPEAPPPHCHCQLLRRTSERRASSSGMSRFRDEEGRRRSHQKGKLFR